MNLTETNRLLHNPEYLSMVRQLESLESERIYCRHDLVHFLDVARIAQLMAMESALSLSPDVIYTTALLHDLGRIDEYTDGTAHHEASYQKAKIFLKELSFSDEEKALILSAIKNHRQENGNPFNKIFYQADKRSRLCFNCPAETTCNWQASKKNFSIDY